MFLIKILYVIISIILFIIQSIFIKLLIKNQNKQTRLLLRNTSNHSKRLLNILNLKIMIDTFSQQNLRDIKSGMIVSNHLSWLDIIIISAVQPCRFITSTDVQKSFLLGYLATLGGSFFVERKHVKNLSENVSTVSLSLKKEELLCLFPEATSSNGDKVIEFKSALFQTLIDTDYTIYPLTLNYLSIDSIPLMKSNRDRAFWYGNMTFLPSLIRVCKCRELIVSLNFLATVHPSGFDNRKELKDYLFHIISENYIPVSD